MDFSKNACLGYAFVNFVSGTAAKDAKKCLDGFKQWKVQSSKVCQACWGEPLQGLDSHVERYRNSPVMHSSVPEEFKPIMFRDGVQVTFPAPTKRIRKPCKNA